MWNSPKCLQYFSKIDQNNEFFLVVIVSLSGNPIHLTMSWCLFAKSFFNFQIFAMCTSSLGSSIVSNIEFPSGHDKREHNDDNSVYTFNFPKNGVFVFNNPTILNLGKNDKLGSRLDDKDIPGASGTNLLCRLSKVSKNIYSYL